MLGAFNVAEDMFGCSKVGTRGGTGKLGQAIDRESEVGPCTVYEVTTGAHDGLVGAFFAIINNFLFVTPLQDCGRLGSSVISLGCSRSSRKCLTCREHSGIDQCK